MKKLSLILAVCMIGLLTATMGLAFGPGGAIVESNGDNGEFLQAADTHDVTSGHVYYANLVTNQSTYRWAGVYGNVSGNIVLGDTNDNIMYEWTGATGKVVYASQAATPAWASIVVGDTSDGGDIAGHADYTQFSLNGATDGLDSTFSGSNLLASNIFTGLTPDSVTTLGGAGWVTMALWDGSDAVWAGNVADQVSYEGSTADYQIALPEDGDAGDQTATTYYLWVELE